MSKQEEASLILELYTLRREETMRQARDWFFREFNPESLADFNAAMFGPHSGHVRMVVTYWDMAAALVKNGAISLEMFDDCNGEHIGTFGKIEPILGEIDLHGLADHLDLNGAQIKSIALGAAFLARSEGTKITMEHLELASAREFAKQGLRLRQPGEQRSRQRRSHVARRPGGPWSRDSW